jgi:hypothetical protein
LWLDILGSEERNERASQGLLDGLELFARFEAHSFSRRNRNLSSGAGIAANTSLARTHIEDSETTQLNAIAVCKRTLHAFEHCLNCHFGFGLGDSRPVHYFVDDVELDHGSLFASES